MLELEVLQGLEQFALREVQASFRGASIDVTAQGRLTLPVPFPSARISLSDVNALRTVTAAYVLERFDVPRPRALLGDQHLRRVLDVCEGVVSDWPRGAFRTLALSAAGAESAVLTRFKAHLAERLGLECPDSGGDLLLRLRRVSMGWDVLVRTSPRPLSTRAWRVCNFPGALNATIAAAMVALTRPCGEDRFVNIGCGSATLLIERLEHGPARAAYGYDVDDGALDCARANAQASGHSGRMRLERCDARSLPLDSGSVDVVVADLPYAMLLGSASANSMLYPALLAEAARVLVPGGRGVFVTTQNRLMRGVLERQTALWASVVTLPVRVAHRGGYITPTIYSLVRRDAL